RPRKPRSATRSILSAAPNIAKSLTRPRPCWPGPTGSRLPIESWVTSEDGWGEFALAITMALKAGGRRVAQSTILPRLPCARRSRRHLPGTDAYAFRHTTANSRRSNRYGMGDPTIHRSRRYVRVRDLADRPSPHRRGAVRHPRGRPD